MTLQPPLHRPPGSRNWIRIIVKRRFPSRNGGFSLIETSPVEPGPDPVPPAANCWYLTGPTAAGKTHVGVELALRLNAEIVSLDSMAVYRGMDIGTAKPSRSEQERVRHHLLDLAAPSEEFSLSEYVEAAHAAIAEIKGRGHDVLFVGGTPLYLKALLRGVYQGPPADWDFRQHVERELETVPLAALHERLQVIDPLLAAKLHPNDKRRIIRGLEVFKLTGQRLSHLQTQFDEGQPASAVRVFVLSWPRDELHCRINTRVEQMFAAGLVEEVRGLITKHGRLSRTAAQAVGYREVTDYLREQGTADREQGSECLEQCIERVKSRTRQFARRQETWFRALSECTFLPMNETMSASDTAQQISELGDVRRMD
jgi:tRNA dimethylallyltransferase